MNKQVKDPELGQDGKGSFLLMDGDKKIGELAVGIKDKVMLAYHTEVSPEYEGQGLGRQLVEALVNYAKKNELKIKPLCTYVQKVFQKDHERFEKYLARQ